MGMNKRQRAHKRLSQRRADLNELSDGAQLEPRAPLRGYEALYEITRSGRVYSLRLRRFISLHLLRGAAYISFRTAGKRVNLPIADAVHRSWGSA